MLVHCRHDTSATWKWKQNWEIDARAVVASLIGEMTIQWPLVLSSWNYSIIAWGVCSRTRKRHIISRRFRLKYSMNTRAFTCTHGVFQSGRMHLGRLRRLRWRTSGSIETRQQYHPSSRLEIKWHIRRSFVFKEKKRNNNKKTNKTWKFGQQK